MDNPDGQAGEICETIIATAGATNVQTFIGIGSNIGDSEAHCVKAVTEILKDSRVAFLAVSSLYRTSPVSAIEQGNFLNAALAITWKEGAEALLSMLQDVEKSMGRQRVFPGGPRTIDLDILLFGSAVIDRPELTIPHPELHRRRFAVVPCLEIDDTVTHPRYGKPLKDFLPQIDATQRVEILKSFELGTILTERSAGTCN
jgi:2-amino-4-hydroxy-6-hydroxymethyldihydropteridine diphosphokinase